MAGTAPPHLGEAPGEAHGRNVRLEKLCAEGDDIARPVDLTTDSTGNTRQPSMRARHSGRREGIVNEMHAATGRGEKPPHRLEPVPGNRVGHEA